MGEVEVLCGDGREAGVGSGEHLIVFTACTLAHCSALNAALEALAVLFKATRLTAVAS